MEVSVPSGIRRRLTGAVKTQILRACHLARMESETAGITPGTSLTFFFEEHIRD